MTTSPRCGDVAVVITTYNHAHFLEAAILSVRAQTLAPAEILVVDDGSDDHPERITSRFADLRLIRQPNAGLAAARNTGWRAATSHYVVFLDADDRLLPEALRINRQRLAADADAGFAYGAYVNVDGATRRRDAAPLRPATHGYTTFLRGNPIGMHATVMYRRAHLECVGGFDAGLRACEDYDLYLRLASCRAPLFGPELLAEYWHHAANMSNDCALMLRSALQVLGRHEDAARRRSALADHRAGIRGWKRHYVAVWWLRLADARSRRLHPSVLREGVALARFAPMTMARVPLVAARRGVRRLSRGVRERRAAAS
jgi:glycosyltransferase involved in cell wall biosynthesis